MGRFCKVAAFKPAVEHRSRTGYLPDCNRDALALTPENKKVPTCAETLI